MWLGYCYIGLTLRLALTIMRPPGDRKLPDVVTELRLVTKWGGPMIYVAVVCGRVFAAM